MTAYASSTARTVFVGTPNQSVVAPRSLSKSSDDNGPSARMRSSTRPAASAFSARMRDAFLLEVTRNHGSSSVETSESPLLYASKISRRSYKQLAPGGVVLGHARMQHEVMAPTGNRERIELDRAPSPEDTRARRPGLPRANALARARVAPRGSDVRPQRRPSRRGRYRVAARRLTRSDECRARHARRQTLEIDRGGRRLPESCMTAPGRLVLRRVRPPLTRERDAEGVRTSVFGRSSRSERGGDPRCRPRRRARSLRFGDRAYPSQRAREVRRRSETTLANSSEHSVFVTEHGMRSTRTGTWSEHRRRVYRSSCHPASKACHVANPSRTRAADRALTRARSWFHPIPRARCRARSG